MSSKTFLHFASKLRAALVMRASEFARTEDNVENRSKSKTAMEPWWSHDERLEGRDWPAETQSSHSQTRESLIKCVVGDKIKIVECATRAMAAFNESDAAWAYSLHEYVGMEGVVEQADVASVKVRHDDGQRVWWAYGAVEMVQKSLPSDGEHVSQRNFEHLDSHFVRLTEVWLQKIVDVADLSRQYLARWCNRVLLSVAVLLLKLQRKSGRCTPLPFMHHDSWEQALFLHLPVNETSLQALLPTGLKVDLHNGHAWVSIVVLTELGIAPNLALLPSGLQSLLKLGHHAVNLRTYVKPSGGGSSGIYFFTLDCSNLLPCIGASLLFHLPYRAAHITRSSPAPGIWRASSSRHLSRASVEVEWEALGEPETEGDVAAEAAFFLERYCLYNEAGPFLRCVAMPPASTMWRGSITHAPWPVQRAHVRLVRQCLLEQLGLKPTGPALAHYSPGVPDIDFFWEAHVPHPCK